MSKVPLNAASLAAWISAMPVDQAESLKLEFAVAIDAAIKSLGLSRKEIADILQTSPAWVTKVLRGDVNLTIESMAKLCNAVGLELQLNVVAKRATAAPRLLPPANVRAARPSRELHEQAGTDAASVVRRKKTGNARSDRAKRQRD